MGSAASTAMEVSYVPPTSAGGIHKKSGAKHRRGNLYEAESTETDAKVEDMLNSDNNPSSEMSEGTKNILLDAIGGFFFLDSHDADSQTHIDLFMKAVERECGSSGDVVMKEGEDGDKLYVVESGELDVTIEGEFIRTLHSGALFGELALIYNAPRSATIKCTTDCVFWCLDRSVFKSIMRVTRSAMIMHRSEWLTKSPEISKLGSVELSRMINMLESVDFKEGEVIHDEGDVVTRVILVEKGNVKIEINEDIAAKTPAEWDEALGISRPSNTPSGGVETNTIELGEGCVLGTLSLDVKARQQSEGLWRCENGEVYCPVKVTALAGGIKCAVFHVDQFVHLYGDAPITTSVKKSLSLEVSRKSSVGSESSITDDRKVSLRQFEESKMKLVGFLGQGGYGTVMLGRYTGETTDYAVKFLAKTSIVAKKQEHHVMNEKSLLASFSSPLILRLYGTYQTDTALVLVTEVVDRGDLWSCMYENETYPEEDGGLPCDLIQFYFTSVVVAVAYIHARKVAFRDLKPENIMLDSKGYIRLIDFGFAKKIPFGSTDKNGKKVIQHKSNTMCGTPEYLAPEFIFCEGNDHGADLWALGVLLHEMLIQTTPFVVDDCEDIQKMFTRIATVKKTPIALNLEIDDKCGGSPHARDLIFKLLKGDPRDRLGYVNHNTKALFKAPYFEGIDRGKIESKEFIPHYIPPPAPVGDEPLPLFDPFTGNDSIFRLF